MMDKLLFPEYVQPKEARDKSFKVVDTWHVIATSSLT